MLGEVCGLPLFHVLVMCGVCLDLCAGHRYICLNTLFGFDRRSVGVFVLFKLEICQDFHCLSRWGYAGVLVLAYWVLAWGLCACQVVGLKEICVLVKVGVNLGPLGWQI